ncbi:MAG: Flp family type IVb pilin [Hyphomicrobium sp.]|nr:Flp family type IVb pilin [Hyphomicrobium sp.]
MTLKKFVADQDGATAIEYALIAGIVSVAIVASLTQVTGQLAGVFSEISNQFNIILN